MRAPGDLARRLAETCAAAAAAGVHMRASEGPPGEVSLDEVEREEWGARGSGSVAIGWLCALADELGLPVGLAAVSRDEGLLGIYRRHGFVVVDDGTNEDGEEVDDVVMRREPGAPPVGPRA